MSFSLFRKMFNRIGDAITGSGPNDAANPPVNQRGLSHKLFAEYDRRVAGIKGGSVEDTLNDIKQRDVFENGTAIIFASSSHNTMNLQIWLETIFDLDVVMVYEPAKYYEWLFRYAENADLVFVERDAFVGDAPAFGTFMCAAQDAYPHCPILVLSKHLEAACEVAERDQTFDIALKSPLTQTSVWLAMKAAADIALNGKTQKPQTICQKAKPQDRVALGSYAVARSGHTPPHSAWIGPAASG